MMLIHLRQLDQVKFAISQLAQLMQPIQMSYAKLLVLQKIIGTYKPIQLQHPLLKKLHIASDINLIQIRNNASYKLKQFQLLEQRLLMKIVI